MSQSLLFSSKGSTTSKPFGNTSSGLVSNISKSLGFSQPQQSNPAPSQPITGGTNTGLISGGMSKPSTDYTHAETTTNPNGGTTIKKPTPNPSVLAQQQALNKQGAGLVEDGLAGPLTQAAIAKYGASGTTTPTVKTEAKVEPPKPVSSANPSEQIQNVGQSGQQTTNESETQQRLIEQSKTASPEYLQAKQTYDDAVQRLADFETALAEKYKGVQAQGISLDSARGQMANIGQAAASELAALQGAVTASSNVLNAANAQQGLQVAAGQSAYSGSQTQAQRATGAQGTVLGAGLLQPTAIGQVPFSQVTGAQGGMIGGQGGLATLGAMQGQQEAGANTQAMIGAFNQAKPLIETAKQQIASAGFNISPIALVNQLQQYVNKGIIPSAEFANIFNTLSEIATTISPVLGAQGAQTDLKTMIAQEFIPKLMQGQDIGSVLDNIEKNALAKIEANKSTSLGTPLQTPTTSGSSTGGFAEQW